jgi:hypothetical protein
MTTEKIDFERAFKKVQEAMTGVITWKGSGHRKADVEYHLYAAHFSAETPARYTNYEWTDEDEYSRENRGMDGFGFAQGVLWEEDELRLMDLKEDLKKQGLDLYYELSKFEVYVHIKKLHT